MEEDFRSEDHIGSAEMQAFEAYIGQPRPHGFGELRTRTTYAQDLWDGFFRAFYHGWHARDKAPNAELRGVRLSAGLGVEG